MLKQMLHSVYSDKNESEFLDIGRGLGIGTKTEGFWAEVSGSGLRPQLRSPGVYRSATALTEKDRAKGRKVEPEFKWLQT